MKNIVFSAILVLILISCSTRTLQIQNNPPRTNIQTSKETDAGLLEEDDEDAIVCQAIQDKDLTIKDSFFANNSKILISLYSSEYTRIRRLDREDRELKEIKSTHQVLLNSEQKMILFDLLYGRKGEASQSACYDPRHLIEFYRDNQRVAFIEICFQCDSDYAKGLPLNNLCPAAHKDVKAFFDKIGLPEPKH